MPETTRLAHTVQTWWPAILVALTERVANARTEGFNRIIKQTKRVGCVRFEILASASVAGFRRGADDGNRTRILSLGS